MATTVAKPKKKRLGKEELAAAERVLLSKYRHMVKGSLRNFSGRGLYPGKRTAKIRCASTGCDAERRVATSDLAQVRHCVPCTLERRAERRRRAARKTRQAR